MDDVKRPPEVAVEIGRLLLESWIAMQKETAEETSESGRTSAPPAVSARSAQRQNARGFYHD